MKICHELGITLQQGFEMSVFEIKCWAAYFKIEADREKQAYQKAKSVRRR